jgi:hypothetical protein
VNGNGVNGNGVNGGGANGAPHGHGVAGTGTDRVGAQEGVGGGAPGPAGGRDVGAGAGPDAPPQAGPSRRTPNGTDGPRWGAVPPGLVVPYRPDASDDDRAAAGPSIGDPSAGDPGTERSTDDRRAAQWSTGDPHDGGRVVETRGADHGGVEKRGTENRSTRYPGNDTGARREDVAPAVPRPAAPPRPTPHVPGARQEPPLFERPDPRPVPGTPVPPVGMAPRPTPAAPGGPAPNAAPSIPAVSMPAVSMPAVSMPAVPVLPQPRVDELLPADPPGAPKRTGAGGRSLRRRVPQSHLAPELRHRDNGGLADIAAPLAADAAASALSRYQASRQAAQAVVDTRGPSGPIDEGSRE